MKIAAARLVGRHDFASFAGDGEGVPWSDRQSSSRGTVRTLMHCSVTNLEPWWCATDCDGQLFEIRIVAEGFLPKMVRNVVGALIEVGSGKRMPEWIDELLAGRDRRLAGMTAPANGLILWRVGYTGSVPDDDRR
jgi:tRNA pseudouridine38-40 synthase